MHTFHCSEHRVCSCWPKSRVVQLLFFHPLAMSPAARLKRALVSMLLQLAHAYGLTLSLTRDSGDDVLKSCFQRVMLRVHPDKPGGSEAKAKGFNDAWDRWTKARRAKGRPPTRNTPFHGVRCVPFQRQRGRRKSSACMQRR